jgi:hypothetical protein
MSAFRPKFTVTVGASGQLLVAISRLSPLHKSAFHLAHRDASGGSRPQHHKRKLARSKDVERWYMTTIRVKAIKIGATVVRHGRYVTFHSAEVAVPRSLFENILSLIDDLRRRPAPA